jgi:hypothetical protein
MPEEEQDRLISGFATQNNLRILSLSRNKLALAKTLNLDKAEEDKLNRAIPILDELVSAFTSYGQSSIGKQELRERVRKVLSKPIPETQGELIEALSHNIQTLHFLAEQQLHTKDNWDQMVDCVQMYDALERTEKIAHTILSFSLENPIQGTNSGGAIEETIQIVRENIKHLESFFTSQENATQLQSYFSALSRKLITLWGDRS